MFQSGVVIGMILFLIANKLIQLVLQVEQNGSVEGEVTKTNQKIVILLHENLTNQLRD